MLRRLPPHDAFVAIADRLDLCAAVRFAATCRTIRAAVAPVLELRHDKICKDVAWSIADHFRSLTPEACYSVAFVLIYSHDPGVPHGGLVQEISVLNARYTVVASVHVNFDARAIDVGIFRNPATGEIEHYSRAWPTLRPTTRDEGGIDTGLVKAYTAGAVQALRDEGWV